MEIFLSESHIGACRHRQKATCLLRGKGKNVKFDMLYPNKLPYIRAWYLPQNDFKGQWRNQGGG